jgi:divalent metal cation (Fe/Co/Zn/Cd) transporter
MVLICISLMISGIKHLFYIVLNFISLENNHLGHLPTFNWAIWGVMLFCFVFCYWVYEFLISFGITPLSYTWFANICSHSSGCLFTVSFALLKWSFIVWCNPICLLLLLLYLCCHVQTNH